MPNDEAEDTKRETAVAGLPTLVTVSEVAEYLQMSETTVYRLISEEGLPAIKVGRNYRVRADELREWLERRAEREASEEL